MLQLSHSSKERYLENPFSWYAHYFLRLREKTASSPLFFGSIVESGIDVLDLGGSLEDAQTVFRKNFKSINHNGQWETLASSPNIKFNKKDLDPDVFTESEWRDLENKSVQFQSWASLQRKGELLIETVHKEIRPKIKKVLATQPQKVIINENGDEILVKADKIYEWEDGRIIIPDYKTSSQSAKQVAQSEQYLKQTALYYAAFQDDYPLDSTGFIVLEKDIRKREPRARVGFSFHVPEEELIQKVIDEFDKVFYCVKSCQFPYTAPEVNKYGQACPYRKFYESGGKDMTGLIKVGRK